MDLTFNDGEGLSNET